MKEVIVEKPIANIILGKRLSAFPPRSETRQECQFSPLLFRIILAVQASEKRQEKNQKNIHKINMQSSILSLYNGNEQSEI